MNLNKKIAIICDYKLFPERIGGMDYFFVAYDTALKEKGYEIIWFFKDVEIFDFYSSLTIISTKNKSVESYFLNFCLMNNDKFDIVITHFIALCTSFYKKVKCFSNPYVITVDHNPRPVGGFSTKKKIFNKIKGKLYYKYIDQFIAVSNYSKENLIKDFGYQIEQKIKVVFNGIETEKYIQKKQFKSHNNFLVACHLRKEKGVQDIIEGIGDLPRKVKKSITLTIYGEGPFEQKLKEIVAINKLHNIVFFKGSSDQLHSIYQYYDYLIHASHGETFCFTVVESLMSNLPVITTKEAGNVLGLVKKDENGYLFNIKQSKQLTEIIQSIITGDKQISTNDFYKNIENQFSIKAMVDNHIKLLACI